MSHRLHRLILILVLVILSGYVMWDVGYEPQIAQITIVDFSKKTSVNPYQELYKKLLYPTVRISTLSSTGSGVVIDDYIISAAHVVDDYTEVQVEIYGASTDTLCLCAFVVITDTVKDLALLQLRNANSELRIYKATLAPNDYTPYLFSPVWAVGCSLGLPPRPSFGHLCALGVSAVNWEISAPILPGNSGGPVFNARTYEVIGIAIWVRTHNGQLLILTLLMS